MVLTPKIQPRVLFLHRGPSVILRLLVMGALLVPSVRLRAQDTAPSPEAASPAAPATEVLTLDQCLQTALSTSDSAAILLKNLKISEDQYKQIVAKNTLSLNGQLGDSATDGFGNTALLNTFESVLPYTPAAIAAGYNSTAQIVNLAGNPNHIPFQTYPTMSGNIIPQTIAGSLSLSGPSTTLSLVGDQLLASVPPSNYSESVIGLNLAQTIWDGYPGGTAKANVQQASLGLQNAEFSADANKLTLLYQIKQAYYSMLSAQRNLAVFSQNLELQKSALEQEQTLYDLQQAEDVDLQTAKINVKSAEIELRSGQQAEVSARKALANIVGLPAGVGFTVAETAEPQVPAQSMDEAIATALDKRVELKQLDLSRRIAAIQLGLIKAQTSPTVALTGGGYLFMDDIAGTNANAISLGVKLGMPILDSGSAAYQEEANRYQSGVLDSQEDQVRRSITLDVENAYESVQLQTDRLGLSKLAAENSLGQYNLKKIQRQYGTATNQDVLAAAVNMVNANNAYATARNALELAILQLQNAMGL
jgi:outer membrane protein TolC